MVSIIDLLKERKLEAKRELAYRGPQYFKEQYLTCKYPRTIERIMTISHIYDAAVNISIEFDIEYAEAVKILLYEMKQECERRLSNLEEDQYLSGHWCKVCKESEKTTFPIFDTSLDFEEEE
ncbi:hypothetical protein GTI81_07660 [Enterococcus faecalis]|uniref:Uncharacterized protein n=1 Tax=Enterococcus faecalis TaxID=1351 RepID=A0AAP6RHM6_ENTFL|nr:hypothetical protein [Enterococcus faecalis]MXS29379.1 hypothetical protein [Enterococcus faecalis]MXS52584.1 hypothetical protein [Enterococcus faecalis]